MTDQRFLRDQQQREGERKEKGLGRMLLTPPAKKLRMSRRKVEH